MKTFTAYVEFDPDTEVVELCLEELGESVDDLPRFVGLQQIEVAV